MRNVILQEFVSVDGQATGRNGSVDFIPQSTNGDQSFGRRQIQFMESIDNILLGRVTYQMFAQYWPGVTSGEDKPFADRINSTPKVVFSRTLGHAPWGSFEGALIARGSPEDEVSRLRREPGKEMVVWGSLSLAQTLIRNGLIDRYELIICPTVLGEGRPLFANTPPLGLKLITTTSFDRGTVLLAYESSKR